MGLGFSYFLLSLLFSVVRGGIALLSPKALLGGSWLVISGVISRVTIVITHIRGLIPPLLTAHEPPSSPKVPYSK